MGAPSEKFPQFEWEDRFCLGVKPIDDQHQHLAAILKELSQAGVSDKGKEAIEKILNTLVEATIAHFKFEEELMQKYLYKDYLSHKRAHEDLLQQLNDLLGRFKKGYLSLTSEVLIFLGHWLKNHMVGTDQQLGDYLKNMSDG